MNIINFYDILKLPLDSTDQEVLDAVKKYEIRAQNEELARQIEGIFSSPDRSEPYKMYLFIYGNIT